MRFLLVIAALLGPDVASASAGWWTEEDAIHVTSTAAVEQKPVAREPPPPVKRLLPSQRSLARLMGAHLVRRPTSASRVHGALRTVRRLIFAPTSDDDDDDTPLS
jgi:hypothetical protein